MYVLKIILISLLFNEISLAAKLNIEKLRKRWQSAFEVNKLYEGSFDSSIKEPVDTLQPIIEILYYGRNFHPVKDCLFFSVPKKNEQGILKITQTKINNNCMNSILEKWEFKQDGIFNFGISLSKEKIILNIDQKSIQLNTPFNNKDSKLAWKEVIGRQYSVNDDEFCFKVDNKCSIEIKNRCDFCLNGHYSLISSSCSKLYNKKCGKIECGTKGNYACIRGFKTVGRIKDYCINDSPVGFCRDGSRVLCINKELVCR